MAGCNGFARLSASPLLGRQGSDFGRRGWRHLGRGGDLRKSWFEAGPVGVATAHYPQPHLLASAQDRAPYLTHHPSCQRQRRIPSVDSGLVGRCLLDWSGLFSHCFALGDCSVVGLLVLQYTGFTSCLTRYRWLAASYAKSERYSFLALLLCTEPLVLFAFRLLVSGSVVLSAVSARCPFGARYFVSGFVVCRGLWAMARFWSGFFGGMAGCLDFSLRSRWSLRGCVVTAAGRLSAACRGFGVASYPWEWKGINKKSPFRWVYPSTTRAIPWERCSSISSPPSPSSKPISSACAPARAWPSPAPRGNCAVSGPNSPTDSSGNSAACMPRVNIPSAISPSSSPSQDQPSIAHSTGAFPLSVRSCPLPESTRPWSPPTSPSTSGPRSLGRRGSPARCWTASPTTSTSWQ